MDAVIVSAVRTPVGKFLGGLAPLSAPALGAIALKAALARAHVPADAVDEVVMGCVVAAGLGQNPARQALIHASIPPTKSAYTINMVCGSGLRAVALAAQAIAAGDAHCVLAGGMESMSNAPYLLKQARTGYRMGNGELVDAMVHDGLWDVYEDYHMGMTGELVAEKYGITRGEQDAYACESHRRAIAAIDAGAFNDEIAPVEIAQKKGAPVVVSADEGPRRDTTMEALGKLRPAFKKDGTVTAGNAPPVNDGAAAVLVMSRQRAKELGVTPIARVVASATGHLEPRWVMLAPIEAVRNLRAKTGLSNAQLDGIELNEAFSVQAMACTRELEMDPARVNPDGGAVALGHPIGASGARILTTLLHRLRREGGQRGLASLCLGGGGAVALAVEMES
ncbi:MAG: acetyl-CoA C-acetyltransferase [Candidatus Sumerlaeia bacterium]|nr:acetyl-CoA C-acetyltransferase [Candidatus Sumerlaeia bacterium]